jgi:hypothetical protein
LWKKTYPKTYCHGNEKVSREKLLRWGLIISLSVGTVRETTFVYVCETLYLCMCVRLPLCMCVRLYIYVCVWDSTFMYVETTSKWPQMKLYERLVNWQLNFPNTFSNAKITHIDLDELIKLGIHYFSSWHHLGFQKLDLSCHF